MNTRNVMISKSHDLIFIVIFLKKTKIWTLIKNNNYTLNLTICVHKCLHTSFTSVSYLSSFLILWDRETRPFPLVEVGQWIGFPCQFWFCLPAIIINKGIKVKWSLCRVPRHVGRCYPGIPLESAAVLRVCFALCYLSTPTGYGFWV